MAILAGLTGFHLENESTGAKYILVRVGWGAIVCTCFMCMAAGAGKFSILDSLAFMHSDIGTFREKFNFRYF